uniref:Fibronectin type-III domain-containing protein n=1 Tax=viral metagenome TaxID=1070528 RepID=A0A6C0F9P4_9ZZZZ|tara:strand:+ start:7078 stop:13662 length:6585 start_codon:yes stop_codon:yes gene_type:complete
MSRPHGILKLAHLPHRDISVGFDPIMAVNINSWAAFKTDVVTKTDAKRGLLETLNNAEGEVSDGYIKNANGQVINVATDAIIERFITNNDGSYQLTTSIDSLPDIIKILIEPGGTDISTNTTHTSELTAIVIKSDLTSSNKVSINPITSMVVSIAEENSTVDATAITNAKTDVKQAFGISDAQLNKDYIKENDNTLAVITAQLETLASTLEDTVGTLTTLSKTQVNTSIAKVLKERSEETAFNLSNSGNIETIVNKIKTVHNIADSDDFTNIKTNAKTYISTINTSINNVTGTFTQRITEATKIKIASSNKITTVKETFKTDSFDSSAVVSDVNTAKTEVTIQAIQAPTRSLISVPGAPTNLSITPGSYSASASWTAPSETGGATISGYKLEYIELSRKVPSSPSGLTASVSVDDATLNWTAPADDGNSPILEYTLNYKADAVSIYCYNHGYMGGRYLISGSSDDYSGATVLTSETVVNVVSTDSGNRYTFNGETTYHENNSYKITGNGTYTFQNVPSGHPIAILNNGISNITYTGDSDKKSTMTVTGTTNDGPYDFYHGDVTVTVLGGADFRHYASNTAINTGSANTTRVIENLPMAVKYFFSVGGNNDIGVGTVSETSISYLAATFPGQPTNLSADIAKTSGTSVLLTWSEPNDGGEPIDSYTAEYSLGPAYSSWVVFNPDPDSTPVDFNKEITGLQTGKLYKFRIRGVNAIGNGLYSDEVTGSPGRYAIEPVFPTMSSGGILTTYIHSNYFYRAYTFTTAYSSSYVLEAGAGGLNGTGGSEGTASAQSQYSNTFSAIKAFNGTLSNDDDCWFTNTGQSLPQWLKFEFPSAKIITRYKLWGRNHTSSNVIPSKWKIQGSNDDTNWSDLDDKSTNQASYWDSETSSFSSSDITNDTNYVGYDIPSENQGSYVYYRIYITHRVDYNNLSGSESTNYTCIGEMAYYSTMATGNDSFTLSGSVSQKFDIFMIGGGGSGGTTWAGGGGGAGSAVLAKNWSISPDTYEIMVGGGGAAITDTTAKGNDGSPTSFGSLFATKGGGGGGTGSSSLKIGKDGGSGGGSSNCVNYVLEAGGIDGLRGGGGVNHSTQGTATIEGETTVTSWTGGPTSVFNGTLSDDTDGVHTDGGIFSEGNSGNNIFHIMFEFPTSTTITKYKIWGRSAASFYSPKSWQLRGATSSSAYNNGSGTYDVLDTRIDEADIGQSYSTSITNDTNRGEYVVSSPGSYTTYVLDIGSSYNSNHCFIGEIAYYSTTSGSNYDGGASKFETASATIDLDSASATKYYKNDPTTYNLSSSQNVTIYGNDGGSSVSSSGSSQDFGAGGGGIGAAGSNATTSSGGAGGAGLANDYRYGPASGTTDLKQDGSVLSHPGIQYYGGGGGGGGDTNTATEGGSNVGGTGFKNGTDAGDAVANTGSGGGGGGYTTITNPIISNPSFENHPGVTITNNQFAYVDMSNNPNTTAISNWTAGRSPSIGGVAVGINPNSSWGNLNSGVGNRQLILQRNGAYVEQTVNVTQGDSYKVTLKAAKRPTYGNPDALLIKIIEDGTTTIITTINSSYSPGLNTTFKDFESSNFTASSNSVTLRLECSHSDNNDHTVIIDDIAMINTSSPSLPGSGSTGIVTVRQLLGVVGVPFSPTNVSGTSGNAESGVSWTVPSWDGNYDITGYKVEYAADPYSSWDEAVASTSSNPYPVTGLTNDTNYKFRVSAINSQGAGSASTPSSVVTPALILPSAPTNVSGAGENVKVSLSWTAPGLNGGPAITDYKIEYKVSTDSWPATPLYVLAGDTDTSEDVTGLTNGTAYNFRVYAKTTNGFGPASSETDDITPSNFSASGGNNLYQYTNPSGTNYQVHVFTSGSTLQITGSKAMDFLLVGGGGAGGGGGSEGHAGGGGGAGQVVYYSGITLSSNVTISIGAGANAALRSNGPQNGSHTTFAYGSTTKTAVGGGGGGAGKCVTHNDGSAPGSGGSSSSSIKHGGHGGSGGGTGCTDSNSSQTGFHGETPQNISSLPQPPSGSSGGQGGAWGNPNTQVNQVGYWGSNGGGPGEANHDGSSGVYWCSHGGGGAGEKGRTGGSGRDAHGGDGKIYDIRHGPDNSTNHKTWNASSSSWGNYTVPNEWTSGDKLGRYYGGGGGGIGHSQLQGDGGKGGGGDAVHPYDTIVQAGDEFHGENGRGGGGGCDFKNNTNPKKGGDGGDGIVIVRYEI